MIMPANHDLLQAAKDGNLANIETALDQGADVNAQNQYSSTVLMIAARHGHQAIVSKLLETPDIDINAKDMYGDTALMMAAWFGYLDVVECLLHGKNLQINSVNVEGNTALMLAADAGHKAIVARLIAIPGIKRNIRDAEGNTALMLACSEGYSDIVALLRQQSLFRWLRKRSVVACEGVGEVQCKGSYLRLFGRNS